MKKNLVSGLLCVALSASLLVGCGSNNNAETANGSEKVTVTFSNFFVEGQSSHELTEEAVAKFNEENPDAEIILEEMPSDAYLTQTSSLGTADDLAEMVMINGSMMKSFSDIGVIIPLTDMIEGSDLEKVMKPGIFEECTNQDDGEIYSIPIATGTYGFILYNTDIFEEVGITEFPKDLDEFKIASDKLLAAGYIPMAMGDKALWPADSLAFSSFVNNFVGNEWFNNIRKHNGEASFTDAEFIAALTAYQKLGEDGTFNEDFASLTNDERQGLYTNGKAAMISAGDWESKNVAENNPEIGDVTKAAAWPAPKENAKATNSIEQSAAWGIAMGSHITDAQKEVVMKFLTEYMYTPEWGKTMIEENNEFVSWECEFDASTLSIPAASVQEALETATPCLNWDATLDPTVKEVYQRGLQEIIMGSITPEDLANDMQEEYELVGE
ncbi:ABC transporter substrate-binding protein [Clostridium sp. DL1XJH146]